jgi:hypothetical protein
MDTLTVPDAIPALEAFLDDLEELDNPEPLEEDEVFEEEELEDEPEELSDEDEDEGDEDEDEGDDEDESEDETEDETEDEPEDLLVELEIEGEAYEVNLEELKAGYLRNEELVKRTTELESTYQEKLSEVEAKELELVKELETTLVRGSVDLERYRNIDWATLRSKDPERYKELRLQALDAQEQLQSVQKRHKDLKQLHEKAQAIKHEVYLKEQVEIAKRLIPDFDKPEFHTALLQYGKEIGYTEDELRSISDARQLLVLNQARLHSESLVRKKSALAKKESKDLPPAIKPGVPKTKTQEEGRKAKNLRSKLSQTHDLKDAAAVLMDFV